MSEQSGPDWSIRSTYMASGNSIWWNGVPVIKGIAGAVSSQASNGRR